MNIRKQSFLEFLVIGYDEDNRILLRSLGRGIGTGRRRQDLHRSRLFDRCRCIVDVDELNQPPAIAPANKPSRAWKSANAPRHRASRKLADTLTSY